MKSIMGVELEHINYDLWMATETLRRLHIVTDPVERNILHAACPSYLSNLLEFLDLDHDGFLQKTINQVRSLTENRTAVQSEKLNNPDYTEALSLIIKTLKELGYNLHPAYNIIQCQSQSS